MLKPGESSGLHTHKSDYVYWIVEGAKLRITDENGAMVQGGELDTKSGESYPWVLEGQVLRNLSNGMVFPATHEGMYVFFL